VKFAASSRYFLKSFSVLRSSSTYAIEASPPLPQRTGAKSEISSPLQTGSVGEPSPSHACRSCGTSLLNRPT
jgi:hypothetical protein